MKRHRFATTALAIVLAATLVPSASVASALDAWTITPIPDDGSGDMCAVISGDRVVWMAQEGYDWEIYTWVVGDGQATNISNRDGVNDLYPQVFGDRIVWTGWNADSTDTDIYTWGEGDTEPTNLTNTPGIVESDPHISGDRVVWRGWNPDVPWTDFVHAPTEIYTWAVGDTQPTDISHREGFGDEWPQVSGDRVVWIGYTGLGADGNDTEIYTWAEGDTEPTNVSNDDGHWDQAGRVSGDRVVWHRYGIDYNRVYTWAVGDVEPTDISDIDGFHAWDPEIDGDRIVFAGGYGSGIEIYSWVEGDTEPTGVSHTTGRQDEHPRISDDRVVWQAYAGLGGFEIYTWAVGDTTPTVVGTRYMGGDEGIVDVSGDRIVWAGHEGIQYPDNQVYIAYPEMTQDPASMAEELLDDYGEWLESGTIAPVGPNARSAAGKARALGNMLAQAYAYVVAGDYKAAVDQLEAALAKCDGDSKPPDFVTYSSELVNAMHELIAVLEG